MDASIWARLPASAPCSHAPTLSVLLGLCPWGRSTIAPACSIWYLLGRREVPDGAIGILSRFSAACSDGCRTAAPPRGRAGPSTRSPSASHTSCSSSPSARLAAWRSGGVWLRRRHRRVPVRLGLSQPGSSPWASAACRSRLAGRRRRHQGLLARHSAIQPIGSPHARP